MPISRERGERRLGREHPRLHRVVRPLDARQVDEPRRAADQRAAGKRKLRYRLQAAFVDRARTVSEPLAAFERATDLRVRLEALELVEGRQVRVLVVEMHDEADG